MTNATKLTDIQLVLLSTASQRDDGNLFPAAKSLKDDKERIEDALRALLEAGQVCEFDAALKQPAWKKEGDRRIGLALTENGRATILGVDASVDGNAGSPSPSNVASATESTAKDGQVRPGTKQALMLDLLQRDQGASVGEIMEGTGWLPHTTRAALTGLRKRGFAITATKVEGLNRYTCAREAAQ